jgi:hypothetical protein
MVNTSASEEPYIKEELIGLKLLKKNHRNKLTGELCNKLSNKNISLIRI